jgi:hypothetical protein
LTATANQSSRHPAGPDGKMARSPTAGRNSTSVLTSNGSDVTITDTVAMPDSVAHVMITPARGPEIA